MFLTQIECDVAKELIKGKNHRQISASTGIPQRSVLKIVVDLLKKYGVTDRTKLCHKILQEKIFD